MGVGHVLTSVARMEQKDWGHAKGFTGKGRFLGSI